MPASGTDMDEEMGESLRQGSGVKSPSHGSFPAMGGMEDRSEILWQSTNPLGTPSTTVSISLFNYEAYITDCLESVAHQTLPAIDLVIVDDCSSDGSVEVAHQWLMENAKRFRQSLLLRHRRNEGLAISRNDGVWLASTGYVFILDADNALYPRCLAALSPALDNCDASFAYCYLEKFGEVSKLQNTKGWDPTILHRGNTIDAMVLHRRSNLIRLGGYSTDMPVMGWEDYDLWFKIAETGGWGALVPEILARYRVHSASMLHQTTNPNAYKLTQYLHEKHPTFFR
jgi:glycosyltransferase involved in cell wall biosynthesis